MGINHKKILKQAMSDNNLEGLQKQVLDAALAAMAEVERISREKALEEAASAVDNAGWYQSWPDVPWEMADEQIAHSVRSVRNLMSPPVKDQANEHE